IETRGNERGQPPLARPLRAHRGGRRPRCARAACRLAASVADGVIPRQVGTQAGRGVAAQLR
ncbi:MAG: hypothetical protein ACRDNW_19275, partial [Trebonia sp.]